MCTVGLSVLLFFSSTLRNLCETPILVTITVMHFVECFIFFFCPLAKKKKEELSDYLIGFS